MCSLRSSDEITCHCAVFGEKGEAQITGVPLLAKSINFEAECDDNGAKDCGALCKALVSQTFYFLKINLGPRLEET